MILRLYVKKFLKGKCSGVNCVYHHPPYNEIIYGSDKPCAYIVEDVGCINRVCKYNHFYKPDYICSKNFYNTSIDDFRRRYVEYSPCNKNCGFLHLSWDNFVRNMFLRSKGTTKKYIMDFLVGIVDKLINDDLGEKREFRKLMNIHKRIMNVHKERYWSKCIKCGLPPYKNKLKQAQLFTIYILKKYDLCIDLSNKVSDWMYENHGKDDCIFIKKGVHDHNFRMHNMVVFMTLSNLSLTGESRVCTFYPSYHMYMDSCQLICTKGGPNLTNYSETAQLAILQML